MRIEFSHSKIVSDQWIDRSLSEMGKNPNFRAYFANFVRVPPLLRSFKAGKFRKVKVCNSFIGSVRNKGIWLSTSDGRYFLDGTTQKYPAFLSLSKTLTDPLCDDLDQGNNKETGCLRWKALCHMSATKR